jgi:hypothetical protein
MHSHRKLTDEPPSFPPPPAFDFFAMGGMEYLCCGVVKQGNFIERCEIQVK